MINLNKYYYSLLLLAISITGAFSQTKGELFISVSTSSTGGKYSPRNVVAIWIESEDGNFIKTLLAYAERRKTHLNKWQASTGAAGSEFNTTDAISGATRSNHDIRTCTWDGTNYQGQLMPNGNYYIWMELTDNNSTGNYSSFLFTKSESSSVLTPSDEPSFSSINIKWEPSETTNIKPLSTFDKFEISPNPAYNKITIHGNNFKSAEIYTVSGKFILSSKSNIIDIGFLKRGFYLIRIRSESGTFIQKIIKSDT